MDMTNETPAHPDWKHRWVNAGNGWDAFSIWKEARCPESEHDQLMMFIEMTGELPSDIMPLDVALYCADPVIDRLHDMIPPKGVRGKLNPPF